MSIPDVLAPHILDAMSPTSPTFHIKPTMCPFISPPLDSPQATPLRLLDFHLRKNPNYPVALLADISPRKLPKDLITWQEVGIAVQKAATELASSWALVPEQNASSQAKRPVIGLLASGDPLAYVVMLLAIMKTGSIPFAISTRNSPAAIAHLLQLTNCQHLLVMFDPRAPNGPLEEMNREQVARSLNLLPSMLEIKLKKMPSLFDLMPRLISGARYLPSQLPPEALCNALIEPTDASELRTIMILHSSGTTKFPKPIYISPAALRGGFNLHRMSEYPWTGKITNCMALPPFHSMGIHIGFTGILCGGTISGLFRPQIAEDGTHISPTVNSVTIMAAMREVGCNIGVFTPSMLQELAESPSSVGFLASMDTVAFGGGPLASEVGNQLTHQGVQLVTMYGSTEAQAISTYFPVKHDPELWAYFSFAPHVTPQLIPRGDNEYELNLLSSDLHRCALDVEETEMKPQVFRTNDLLAKHPTLPLYQVIGRVDDQIMLSTSEKTNPGPLEVMLCSDPAIAGAVMFGRGKPRNGVLLEPPLDLVFDIKDDPAMQNYLDQIWPTVEKVNDFAPSHSRLSRDLILITDPRSLPLPRTTKGTVSRSQALNLFEKEIEIKYKKASGLVLEKSENSFEYVYDDAGQISPPKLRCAVQSLTEKIIGHSIKTTQDLFKQGCDSLHATQIRSQLLQICHAVAGASLSVPQNIVYQYPTLDQLADWVIELLAPPKTSAAALPKDLTLSGLKRLQAAIAKYQTQPTKVFLVTGTTGSLGAHVLEDLLQTREVDRVYALNRSSASASALQRHTDSFAERGLSPQVLDDRRLTFLEADTIHDLPLSIRNELSTSVTHVLHLSYPVNFNLSLKSFEESIQFTKNLADILIPSPARSSSSAPTFLFASSVSTLANYQAPEDQWVDESDVPLSSCLGSGYGESKRVCEELLRIYAQRYGFNCVILRIGQLCGNRKNGAWNKTEWFPLLVQSGIELGCLPDGADQVAWTPVDEGAAAINDLAFYHRKQNDCRPEIVIRHIAHPKPVAWHTVVTQMAHKLTSLGTESKTPVELVSYQEWLDRLVALAQRAQSNHSLMTTGAIKLVDHFQGQLKSGGGLHDKILSGFEAMGVRRLVTTKTECESPALRNCSPLDDRDTALWFDYWRECHLL